MTDTNESESRCMIIKSTYRDGASESVTFMAPTAAECAEMARRYNEPSFNDSPGRDYRKCAEKCES